MRIAFVKTLTELAQQDPRIILLTADLGYSVFENFIERFPRQFINVGVAEQNMTGIAAGLAMEGRLPYIYSIIPFVTMRNFEQIRNDICYQNLNVKIVGVGAGFSYGPYGHTHHALEDIGILRTLPNLNIVAPGDPLETQAAVDLAYKSQEPFYIRLGRAGDPAVHADKPHLKMGEGIVLEKGESIVILATSTMLHAAAQIVEMLRKKKINPTFVSLPFIKPLDKRLIVSLSQKNHTFITIEEHFLTGGLATAVSEVVAQESLSVQVLPIAVPDGFIKVIGKQEFMREAVRLGNTQILDRITRYIFSRNH